jgi:hypothetical protein
MKMMVGMYAMGMAGVVGKRIWMLMGNGEVVVEVVVGVDGE